MDAVAGRNPDIALGVEPKTVKEAGRAGRENDVGRYVHPPPGATLWFDTGDGTPTVEQCGRARVAGHSGEHALRGIARRDERIDHAIALERIERGFALPFAVALDRDPVDRP